VSSAEYELSFSSTIIPASFKASSACWTFAAGRAKRSEISSKPTGFGPDDLIKDNTPKKIQSLNKG
jgi:hypothetical protein